MNNCSARLPSFLPSIDQASLQQCLTNTAIVNALAHSAAACSLEHFPTGRSIDKELDRPTSTPKPIVASPRPTNSSLSSGPTTLLRAPVYTTVQVFHTTHVQRNAPMAANNSAPSSRTTAPSPDNNKAPTYMSKPTQMPTHTCGCQPLGTTPAHNCANT